MTTSGRMGPDDQSVNTAPVDDLHKRPENTHWILYSVLAAAFVGLHRRSERLVIAVHCPDRSANFESAVADLKLVDEN
ncbi:hypothetical protein R1X32_30070 [Rhodococcus opacus]|uniref:hypothetical protein n=1 Tax=Rhodococcus TaxID=1827 RepID=UPI0014247C48|nr:hypothetical protein [Rhodococcus sp. A14]WKN56055.1 hypothetical protein HJ581_0020950 [Rhodococcus opacus]